MYKDIEHVIQCYSWFTHRMNNIMLIILYLMHKICASISTHVNSSNVTISDALTYEREPQKLALGEAALGGMMSTSIMILLMALIRIMQIYQRRMRTPPDDIRNINIKPTDHLST